MLFIMIMEPLQRMFDLATSRGLQAPLARSGLRHRLSMFADDVMIFIKPYELDMNTCASLLQIFGEASGLHVNLNKSAAFPIRCSVEIMAIVEWVLGCPSGSFPCRYLGLPLTLHKQYVAQLTYLVGQLAGALPRWKATSKMPKSGRLILISRSFVQFHCTPCLLLTCLRKQLRR